MVGMCDTRAHVWDAAVGPTAELEQDSFDQRSMIEDDVRGHVRFHPRRDDEGRHTHAVAPELWPVILRSRRRHVIVESPMFVVDDDEQRLIPLRAAGYSVIEL